MPDPEKTSRRVYTATQRANSVRAVFEDYGGNVSAASLGLGIPERTLNDWVEKARARGEIAEEVARATPPFFAEADGSETAPDALIFERAPVSGEPIGKGQPEHERMTLMIEAFFDGMSSGGNTKIGKATLSQLSLAMGILIDKRRQLLSDALPSEEKIMEIVQRHVSDRATLEALGADFEREFAPLKAAGRK